MPNATLTPKLYPRQKPHIDKDFCETYFKRHDEVVKCTINWAKILDGDTISASSWEVSGPTTANAGTSGDTAYIDVGPGYGRISNTITTAAGYTHKQTVRYRSNDPEPDTDDFPLT